MTRARGALGALARRRVGRSIARRGSRRGRPRRARARRVLVRGALALAALIGVGWIAAYVVPLPERLDYADSAIATYRDGEIAHALLSEDDKYRFPTRLRDVDPAYIDALLAREDRRFRWHFGVDPIAVGRAAIQNLRAGSVESGASTITMQLVRLLEPRPRTLRAKFVESLRAMQLEARLSKDEILEAYLRFAPYGDNIEGVEAASHAFWGRSPSGLSAPEIATLLAIPQNPAGRRPSEANRDTLRAARDRIAKGLAEDGAIPKSERPEALEEALEETEVPSGASRPPRDIPHLARQLARGREEAAAGAEIALGADALRVRTTLDRRVQRRTAERVREHAARLRARGAPHAAVVVIEPESGRVAALVGNMDFDPETPGTALPAYREPRSTGSLLKPVAYAAALDEGLVAPSHALLDVPIARGDYRPENFDRRYRGLVEAERALSESLNIPFVRLVEDLGVDSFVQAMVRFEQVGAARRAGHGGLELVVGGMPATPLEVAALYAGFARGGEPVAPALYEAGTERGSGGLFARLGERATGGAEADAPARGSEGGGGGFRAISPAAAWLTTRALTRRPSPQSDAGPRRAREEGYAWKTGTSFAYHDAWTAGYGNDYAVAVWAGDLAFGRHPELVGADVAAPLFFDVIRAIDDPAPVRAEKPAEGLAEIEICTRSGRRAGPHCEHTGKTLAPARTAAPTSCHIHDEIVVDAETDYRLPHGCRPSSVKERERRVVTRPPAPLARFQRARGRRAGTIPAPHPACRSEPDGALAISSPREGDTVVLDSSRPAEAQKLRLEAYASEGSEIHWYLDGDYHASAAPSEAAHWTPKPGSWTIAAVDDRGNRAVRELEVEGSARGGER